MFVIFCLNYTDVFHRPSLQRIGLQDGRLFYSCYFVISLCFPHHFVIKFTWQWWQRFALNSCSLSCFGSQTYLKIFLFINHLSQIIFRFYTPLRVFKLGYYIYRLYYLYIKSLNRTECWIWIWIKAHWKDIIVYYLKKKLSMFSQ